MNKDYLVVHTPGAFGNFIGYLIDCHQQDTLLPPPFVESGAAHNRTTKVTESLDMVIPGTWDQYHQQSSKKTTIGCVWQPKYFPYILHSYYGRTNGGQYGKCGVESAEKNFYNFVINHMAVDRVSQNIGYLKQLFDVEVNEQNQQVPRNVLRMFFWFVLFEQENNIVTATNQQIKKLDGVKLLEIEDVLNYDKLKLFFAGEFSHDIDFKQLHHEFIQRNRSLADYTTANIVINAVKANKHIEIEPLSVIGEAIVFYELEKHYFDVPFFNLINFFKNTRDIVDYIKHYPDFMKQPNKLYCQHHNRFPRPTL